MGVVADCGEGRNDFALFGLDKKREKNRSFIFQLF